MLTSHHFRRPWFEDYTLRGFKENVRLLAGGRTLLYKNYPKVSEYIYYKHIREREKMR